MVSVDPLGVRWSSVSPVFFSRPLMARLAVGWVMPSERAAAPTLPRSATMTRTSRTARSGQGVMPIVYGDAAELGSTGNLGEMTH